LKVKLEKLKSRYSKEKIWEWYYLIDTQQWNLFVEDILKSHYDPTYYKSMQWNFNKVETSFKISDWSNYEIENLLNYLQTVRSPTS
jgi:tRNA 2-selenouridine synthase